MKTEPQQQGTERSGASRGDGTRTHAWVYILLHVMLVIYSFSSVCSKLAAGHDFMSWGFILCYGGMICGMGLYAIGWQQVIKRMPLTVAYANKAVTLIWGLVWGLLLFHEQITVPKLIGAAIVLAGVVLYSLDGDADASEAHEEG